MADVQPILQVKDLYKRFGGLVAVDHVSLDIHPGEVVGLLGDNGAGKKPSTRIWPCATISMPVQTSSWVVRECAVNSAFLKCLIAPICCVRHARSLINWISAFLSCALLSANSLAVNARLSPLPVPCTGKPI